ncbi:UNKNOWN [Stylonychia lemnae]|uniref:Uncharacterized protein n=1 Tax=Stylonychia lemnae TaxID=5949 RepID=A0A078ARY3_STYLE|nr:UNKNOWN [Stylonychia lemnae]|eukprot:CDW84741.1 UNKNOWN [Stylonychia lemnae]
MQSPAQSSQNSLFQNLDPQDLVQFQQPASFVTSGPRTMKPISIPCIICGKNLSGIKRSQFIESKSYVSLGVQAYYLTHDKPGEAKCYCKDCFENAIKTTKTYTDSRKKYKDIINDLKRKLSQSKEEEKSNKIGMLTDNELKIISNFQVRDPNIQQTSQKYGFLQQMASSFDTYSNNLQKVKESIEKNGYNSSSMKLTMHPDQAINDICARIRNAMHVVYEWNTRDFIKQIELIKSDSDEKSKQIDKAKQDILKILQATQLAQTVRQDPILESLDQDKKKSQEQGIFYEMMIQSVNENLEDIKKKIDLIQFKM